MKTRERFLESNLVYLMTALCFAHLYFRFQNLIAKVKDSSDVRCGPGSTAGLIGERVDENIFETHETIFHQKYVDFPSGCQRRPPRAVPSRVYGGDPGAADAAALPPPRPPHRGGAGKAGDRLQGLQDQGPAAMDRAQDAVVLNIDCIV